MKINKRFTILILACTFAIISIFFITQIYAKYISSANGNAAIPISRWNIKVNTADIITNSDISSNITPIFPGNANIASGIIAPTAEGYFDLVFDFSAVDVSFKYDITTTAYVSSPVLDLVSTGYSVDGGAKVNFTNYNDTITSNIYLTDHITARTIRIYVMWNDNPNTSTMNNLDDTLSTTLVNNSGSFNVSVALTQITN